MHIQFQIIATDPENNIVFKAFGRIAQTHLLKQQNRLIIFASLIGRQCLIVFLRRLGSLQMPSHRLDFSLQLRPLGENGRLFKSRYFIVQPGDFRLQGLYLRIDLGDPAPMDSEASIFSCVAVKRGSKLFTIF